MKIYVDVLFFINLISDYLLLSATAFLLKIRASVRKKMVASVLGALFASIVFFLPLGAVSLFPATIGMSVLMIAFVFGFRRGMFLAKAICSFYLISFAASGAMFGFCYLKNTPFALKSGILYADIPIYGALTLFLFALTILHFSCGFIRKARIRSRYLYDITIIKDGKSVKNKALLDTGNFLTDPMTQKSVLIAEWDVVSALFDAETPAEAVAKHPGEFIYIPLKTISGNTGIFAFCPDEIRSAEISMNDSAYVGISEKPLDSDGYYRMILPCSASLTERM